MAVSDGDHQCLDDELDGHVEGHRRHLDVVDQQLDIGMVGRADAVGGELDHL